MIEILYVLFFANISMFGLVFMFFEREIVEIIRMLVNSDFTLFK